MVHCRGHARGALVLAMAAGAYLNVGVKRRGLPLQQRRVIGMAAHAFGRLDALNRGMAGNALVR